MRHKLIIDGNAVYEIDDDCLNCQAEKAKEQQNDRRSKRAAGPTRMEQDTKNNE